MKKRKFELDTKLDVVHKVIIIKHEKKQGILMRLSVPLYVWGKPKSPYSRNYLMDIYDWIIAYDLIEVGERYPR